MSNHLTTGSLSEYEYGPECQHCWRIRTVKEICWVFMREWLIIWCYWHI